MIFGGNKNHRCLIENFISVEIEMVKTFPYIQYDRHKDMNESCRK